MGLSITILLEVSKDLPISLRYLYTYTIYIPTCTYTYFFQVLPFVLLGLGVDDSFVICNAFGNTDPRKSITDRMSESLGHSGRCILNCAVRYLTALLGS